MPRNNLIVGMTLLIGALLLAASGYWGSHPAPKPPSLRESEGAAVAALQKGNYDEAQKIAATVEKDSTIMYWEYFPFASFAQDVASMRASDYPGRLDAWVSAQPHSALPYAVRAAYRINAAERWRAAHSPKNADAYRDGAHDDAKQALTLDTSLAYAALLRLTTYGEGGEAAHKSAFEQAVAQFPTYYPLYGERLAQLSPARGGSIDAMPAFVRETTAKLPENSPLKVLALDAYVRLIADGPAACMQRPENERDACLKHLRDTLDGGPLPHDAQAAITLAFTLSPYQFDRFFITVTRPLVTLPYAAPYLQKLLHWSSVASGGRSVAAHLVEGAFFDGRGNYSSAVTAYAHAETAAKAFPFPGTSDQNASLSGIYEHLALSAQRLGRYDLALRYIDTAATLDKELDTGPFIRCESVSHLKNPVLTVSYCTAALAFDDTNEAFRYWRAKSALTMDNFTDAKNDFRILAAAHNDAIKRTAQAYLPAIAVLEQSAGALTAAQAKGKPALATAYAQRCQAFAAVEEYKRAFDDCTTSLTDQPNPAVLNLKNAVTIALQKQNAQEE